MIRKLLPMFALAVAGAVLADGTAAPQNPATGPADAAAVPAKSCVQETGSRLPRKAGECQTSVPGRSYDSEQLTSTGATDVSEALRQLDSSVTIRR